MHAAQSSQGEPKEFAQIDRAILGVLLNPDNQRPWCEAELARGISSTPGKVRYSLERLHRAGLVHRWNGLVSASHAAVRFEDATLSEEPGADCERRHENAVLNVLLENDATHESPMSEREIRRSLHARNDAHKLAVTDALTRLDGAGLVERNGEMAFATPAAVRFDQIMDL